MPRRLGWGPERDVDSPGDRCAGGDPHGESETVGDSGLHDVDDAGTVGAGLGGDAESDAGGLADHVVDSGGRRCSVVDSAR